MLAVHTFALVVAMAGLAVASPPGLDLIARQNSGNLTVVVDKNRTVSMALGTPPQKFQAHLSIDTPYLFVMNRKACSQCSDDFAYFDPSNSGTYKKTDQFTFTDLDTTAVSEDTMGLAGWQYDAVPFVFANKPPSLEGFYETDDAAYLGLKYAQFIVGNSSYPQPWWLSLEPEKLVRLDVTRGIASSGTVLKTDFGRISFGEVDQSLINGTPLDSVVIREPQWAVALDAVRVDGQEVPAQYKVPDTDRDRSAQSREPIEKPNMGSRSN